MGRASKEANTLYNRKYRAKNREHFRAYWRKRYYSDIEVERRKARFRQSKSKTAKMQLVRDAKSKPCTDCGVQYPFYVMDLDHVRGEKLIEFGTHEGSIEAVKAELEKCEAVCANCHRIRTWQRKLTANT